MRALKDTLRDVNVFPPLALRRSGLAPGYSGFGLARDILVLPAFGLYEVVMFFLSPHEEIRRIEREARTRGKVINAKALRASVLGECGQDLT